MSEQQLQPSELGAAKIGFVGLGHMGGAMVGRLLQTGHAVEMLSIASALGYERRDLPAIFDVLDRMTAHQSVAA